MPPPGKGWKRKATFWCGVLAGLMALAVPVCLIVRSLLGVAFVQALDGNFNPLTQPWDVCHIPHPAGEPAVAFLQRQAHPFLTEYDYQVRFGPPESGVLRWLPLNHGGKTRENIYWYPAGKRGGPYIRVHDARGDSLLRLNDERTYLLVRDGKRLFAGELTTNTANVDQHGEWGTDHRPPGFVITVNGRPASDITSETVGQGPGDYLGRIEDTKHGLRFVPAADEPEQGPAPSTTNSR